MSALPPKAPKAFLLIDDAELIAASLHRGVHQQSGELLAATGTQSIPFLSDYLFGASEIAVTEPSIKGRP
jgi:hypothetical protein